MSESSAQQRILAVPRGSSLPLPWRFVQLIGKETNPLTGQWEDLVLCEFRSAGEGTHVAGCPSIASGSPGDCECLSYGMRRG